MNIEELKSSIENNIKLSNILVFNCKNKNADFIFHQYINKYAMYNSMDIVSIEDISTIHINSLFSNIVDNNDVIYIYDVKKLDYIPNTNINIWIKCSNVSKKIYDSYSDIIIDIPKIEEWQIKDYINTNLPLVSEENRCKLYNNYKEDLFRLELEIEKLKLFTQDIYVQIEDQLYVDNTEYTIFDITNAILRRDITTLNNLKYSIQYIDIDPFGLLKILLTNFRYVIDIQLAKNSTPEYVGVSNKQFWAIKNYSCGFYSKDELIYIYKFLLLIDSRIKCGELPVDIVIDYIICKIMLL